MKKAGLLFLTLTLILFSSCTIVTFQTTNGKLMYDANVKPYDIVGSFSETVTEWALIYGLVRLNEPSKEVEKFFNEQISKYNGDAVINIKLVYHYDAIQLLISSITYSILSPRSVTVSGDVIKYKK